MPEYLAPGVYVEETSFRSRSIEGVSTSTTGMIGPARFGPVGGEPQLVTSFGEFTRIFGGLERLEFDGEDPTPNYLAHAARAYFENGGRRLYICRLFRPLTDRDGCAQVTIGSIPAITIRARHPGNDGRVQVTFSFRRGRNALVFPQTSSIPGSTPDETPIVRGISNNDTVTINNPNASRPTFDLFRAVRTLDDATGQVEWQFEGETGPALTLDDFNGQTSAAIQVLTVNVEVSHLDADGRATRSMFWEGLTFEPVNRTSLSQTFAVELGSSSRQAAVPVIFEVAGTAGGIAIAGALIDELTAGPLPADLDAAAGENRLVRLLSSGASDGLRPNSDDYIGREEPRAGLVCFEDVADISIVAAPGHSASEYELEQTQAIADAVIAHCVRMQYRIAVLDARQGSGLTDVRDFRAKFDSTHAAFYFPWVRTFDPVTLQNINLPPSGFIAGIYARNDIENGVHKAPANEVIRLATGFEAQINQRQQEVLNPEGINVLRFFEGRGNRVWGARTMTSDSEWKYVNLRRYFAYLERSIDRGTQFAVFENNGPRLWANVRRAIEDFLFSEFQSAHLFGRTPAEAYFVRCDLTTMTQNDLDNGRLICLVGVSPLRPAEFVIFRIGQFTASRPN